MSDFLYRMVERTRGIGKAVQPIVAPLFAPEPAITEYRPTMGDGEKIERGSARLGTESGITARTRKQVTTRSADLTTRPLEERGVSRAPSKPPVSITGPVKKLAEQSEQKRTGYSTESDSPESEPEIAAKKQTGSPEIVRSNKPELAASDIKSPPHNDNDVFTFVSHFIQCDAQQSSADLLMEEPKILHERTENRQLTRESAVIVRTDSTVSSPAEFHPKTVIHREHPVSRFDDDSVSTPGGMPAPPTVQVTIGRIEVRATPLPLQSLIKTKPPANALSLDEYLGRRNGGGQ